MTKAAKRASGLDLLLVALLCAAPLLPGLLQGRTLFYRDIGQYYIPNRYVTVEAIRSGSFPLWNPQRNGGQPFLANPNSFVLRPTTLLFLPFPPRLVWIPMTLAVIALYLIAGWGTWALLADCGVSRPARLVGAAAFALSGPVQSLGQLQNHLEGIAFLPAALWALRRSFVRGWRPWSVVAGLFFGLIISAGEPVWIAVAILAAFALPGLEGTRPRQAIRPAAIAFFLGILVASAQLIPLLENVVNSERGGGLLAEEVLKWSLPPQVLLQTAVPGFWGDPTRLSPGAYWGTWLFESSLPWLLSIHLGAPVLLLAAAGAWKERKGAGGRAAGLAILGAVLALGRYTPLYPFLVRWLPGAASVRFPIKWFLLTTWCAAILAAIGFDRLMSRARQKRDRAEIAAFVLAAAALGAGALMATGGLPAAAGLVRSIFDVPAAVGDDVLAGGAVRLIGAGTVVAAGAVLLLLFAVPRDEATTRARSRVAAALACAVLLWGAWGLNPSAPPGAVFEPSPLLSAMPEVVEGNLRFFGFPRPPGFAFRTPSPEYAAAMGLTPDSLAWGMRWDVRTLRYATFFSSGAKGAYDRAGDSRLDLLPGSSVGLRLKDEMPLPEAVRFLAASSVGYILAHADLSHPDLTEVASLANEANVPVKLYRIASPAPRAELVERSRPVATLDDALSRIGSPGFDPREEVLLGPSREAEGGLRSVDAPAVEGAERAGTAGITGESPCSLTVKVSARRPAWLVVTDTFEPSWRASVDGAPAPILRANAMFRAVRVSAGEHEVVFRYLPTSFVVGSILSLLAIASGIGLILAGPRRATP